MIATSRLRLSTCNSWPNHGQQPKLQHYLKTTCDWVIFLTFYSLVRDAIHLGCQPKCGLFKSIMHKDDLVGLYVKRYEQMFNLNYIMGKK